MKNKPKVILITSLAQLYRIVHAGITAKQLATIEISHKLLFMIVIPKSLVDFSDNEKESFALLKALLGEKQADELRKELWQILFFLKKRSLHSDTNRLITKDDYNRFLNQMNVHLRQANIDYHFSRLKLKTFFWNDDRRKPIDLYNDVWSKFLHDSCVLYGKDETIVGEIKELIS